MASGTCRRWCQLSSADIELSLRVVLRVFRLGLLCIAFKSLPCTGAARRLAWMQRAAKTRRMLARAEPLQALGPTVAPMAAHTEQKRRRVRKAGVRQL